VLRLQTPTPKPKTFSFVSSSRRSESGRRNYGSSAPLGIDHPRTRCSTCGVCSRGTRRGSYLSTCGSASSPRRAAASSAASPTWTPWLPGPTKLFSHHLPTSRRSLFPNPRTTTARSLRSRRGGAAVIAMVHGGTEVGHQRAGEAANRQLATAFVPTTSGGDVTLGHALHRGRVPCGMW